MDLKVTNNIDNNIFSTNVTVDAFGTEQLSELEEKNLLENFPVKLAYRNLTFSKRVKIVGSVPEIGADDENGENVITVTIPALSNKEIPIDGNFNAYYKVDYTKIPLSAVDKKVLTNREMVAQAYCLVFSNVICNEVKRIMGEIRVKAPAFEGETVVPV